MPIKVERLGEAFGTAATPSGPSRSVSGIAGILSRRTIPDRRPLSYAKRGIKLIINHDHLALVLRVKQELEDAA